MLWISFCIVTCLILVEILVRATLEYFCNGVIGGKEPSSYSGYSIAVMVHFVCKVKVIWVWR
jgi:hypothetical protein